MSEIKIRNSDKELTSFEVFMKVGNMLVALLAFIGLFIGIWVFEGTILPMIFCGLPLTFVVIMLVYQMMMIRAMKKHRTTILLVPTEPQSTTRVMVMAEMVQINLMLNVWLWLCLMNRKTVNFALKI